MNLIIPLGMAITFLALFVSLIFSFTTMRRLRRFLKRDKDFEMDCPFFINTNPAIVAVCVSVPKFWRDHLIKKDRYLLQIRYEWLMQNTKLWERIIARTFIALLYLGIMLVMVGSLLEEMISYLQ